MVSSYTSTSAPPHAPVNDSGFTQGAPGGPGAGPPAPDRSLGRRSSLPAGRAIVGATLVVVAAVLTFVGYVLATAKPTQTYLVAATKIEPNQPLQPGQFRPITGDLPAEVRGSVYQRFDQVKEGVLLTPLEPGALVTTAHVVNRSTAESRYVVPFTAKAWQLNGVKQGDTLVLLPNEERNTRSTGSSGVRVRIVDMSSGAGSNGDQVLMAAADSATDYEQIVNVVKGDFWVVRDNSPNGTGAAGGGTGSGPLGGGPTTGESPATTTAPATPSTTTKKP